MSNQTKKKKHGAHRQFLVFVIFKSFYTEMHSQCVMTSAPLAEYNPVQENLQNTSTDISDTISLVDI